jgi:hypothetical protein
MNGASRDRLSLSAASRTIPGGNKMSFFGEFERSYTGQNGQNKDKKNRNERKEQDRQMETEQKQRRDRNDPYYE